MVKSQVFVVSGIKLFVARIVAAYEIFTVRIYFKLDHVNVDRMSTGLRAAGSQFSYPLSLPLFCPSVSFCMECDGDARTHEIYWPTTKRLSLREVSTTFGETPWPTTDM